MLVASWALFIVLAVLWTAGALMAWQLLNYAVATFRSGVATTTPQDIANLPLPGWLHGIADERWIEAGRHFVVQTLEVVRDVLPYAEPAVGWLLTAVWLLWSLGMLLLLLLAVLAHLMVRRWRDRGARYGESA